MAVVINAKGTSIKQFQIGKQGPLIKNVSGNINFKDSTDSSLAGITIDSVLAGAPAGGEQGSGTVNATAYFINGVELTTPQVSFNSDTFTGTGSQTAFTLSSTPANEDAILVAVSGLVQDGGVDFTVSGTTLTFTTAPPNGVKILILFRDVVILLDNSVTTKTSAYTTVAGDDIVLADSTSTGFTITLGSAAVVISGNQIIVKDSGGNSATNNITIATEAAETIDGAATLVLANNFESYTLISNGTNWFINGHVQPADLGII